MTFSGSLFMTDLASVADSFAALEQLIEIEGRLTWQKLLKHLDNDFAGAEEGLEKVEALIRGHFALGGTMINMNVINNEKILEAHKDPSRFPDLIVRVTGFSAYFASLSKELRQLIVDRIIAEER